MKLKTIGYSTVIIMTFLAALYGIRILSGIFSFSFSTPYIQLISTYSLWIILSVVSTGLLFRFKNIVKVMGLNKGIITGFVFACATVFPMFLSAAIAGKVAEDLSLSELIQRSLLAGFMEEYLFRGFLFGILFLKLGWGFIPASMTGALIFGAGHLYQGSSLPETAGVFFITALGAVWFSWLYIEWKNNLWVPVFLHILMNLSWQLFDVSQNALGGIYPNIFRIITIALTVIITIRYNRKSGMQVNRRNLMINTGKELTNQSIPETKQT